MMIKTSCILLSLLLVLNMVAQTGGVRVWAVSDGVRVDPVDGRIFEARPDIHQDYPANDFRTANSVWDGMSRTVSLKAARKEFAAFQVVIEAQQPITDVGLRFDGVSGPGFLVDGGVYLLGVRRRRMGSSGLNRVHMENLLPAHCVFGSAFSYPEKCRGV
jgi:hypothetical protein